MNVEINWLAVIFATAASMAVGSIWYSRSVFGNIWMRLAKVDQKKAAASGMRPIVITIIVSFATAFVLAHMIYLASSFFHNTFLQDALTTAFWLWVGLTAARFITHDAFEGRPLSLTILNCTHELVTLLIMAGIIGIMGVQA